MCYFILVNMSFFYFECIKIPQNFKVNFNDQKLKVSYLEKNFDLLINKALIIDIVGSNFLYLRYNPQILKTRGSKKRLWRQYSSLFFTYKKKINQIFFGFVVGYHRLLSLEGVGYKAEINPISNFLRFKLGFSHEIKAIVPKEVLVCCPKETVILLKSESNDLLGSLSANFQRYKSPDVYKKKGVLISGNFLQIKKLKKK